MSDPAELPEHPVEPFGSLDERTLDELYEHAPCGYLSLLADGTIARVNATFLEWTGLEAGTLLGGMRFSQLLTVGGRMYYETHCAPLIAMTGSAREIALDVRCADGRALPILFGATTHVGTDGHDTVVRVTVFDVSQRRRYERQLMASRDAERAARERSEALQRIGARVAGLTTAPQVGAALAGELVGGGIAVSAQVFRSTPGAARAESTFRADADGGFVGLLPLTDAHDRVLGTLRVQLTAEPLEAEETFLQAAAEIGGRALERITRQAALARSARLVDITGLPHRQWWKGLLEEEFREALKSRRHLTIALVEIDRFDQFTQTHGHVAADRLLLAICDAWRATGHDLLSRFGGEEFAVVLAGLTEREARTLQADVRRGLPVRDAFTAGIVQWDRLESGPELLRRAEAVLTSERQADTAT